MAGGVGEILAADDVHRTNYSDMETGFARSPYACVHGITIID